MTEDDRPPTDAERASAQALLQVSRVLVGVTLRAVAAGPVALTVPQHRVLVTIADGPRRVGELAEDLGVNQSNASRIVGRLAAQGLLQRVPDEKDGRASLVALTAEGQRALDGVQDHRRAALLSLVRGLSDDGDQVVDALARLAAVVETWPRGAGGPGPR